MGCIYMHVNKINFKKYVGQTIYDWLYAWERFGIRGEGYGNCRTFYSAIKKYGWDNFYHICLFDEVEESDLNWLEQMCIRVYNTHVTENGYNVTMGGKYYNGKEVREKIAKSVSEYQQQEIVKWYNSEIHKSENLSELTRKRLSESKRGEKHHFYGKKLSKEHVRKMSESRSGKSHSDNWNRNISESLKGRKLSDEHRKAISESRRGLVMSEEGKIARSKPIVVSKDNFKTYTEFYGTKKAAEELHLGNAALWSVLSGYMSDIKGYKAIYKEDLEKILSGEVSYESIQKYRNSVKRLSRHKGVPLSEEHKNNISKATRESKKHPVKAIHTKTGEERVYDRVKDMCKDLGLASDTTVYRCLNGKKKSYKGWVFVYL